MQATEVLTHHGKPEDGPVPVAFSPNDPENPIAWRALKRWRGKLARAKIGWPRRERKAAVGDDETDAFYFVLSVLFVALTVSYTSACTYRQLAHSQPPMLTDLLCIQSTRRCVPSPHLHSSPSFFPTSPDAPYRSRPHPPPLRSSAFPYPLRTLAVSCLISPHCIIHHLQYLAIDSRHRITPSAQL